MKYIKLFSSIEEREEFEQTIDCWPIIAIITNSHEIESIPTYYGEDDVVINGDDGNNDPESDVTKTINNIVLRPRISNKGELLIDYFCDYLVESDIELELEIPGIDFRMHVPFFKASTFITGTKIDVAIGATSNNISVLNITIQEDSYYVYNFIVRPTVEFTLEGTMYTVDYGTTWSKFLGYSILGIYDVENKNSQFNVDNVFIVEGVYQILRGDSGGSND